MRYTALTGQCVFAAMLLRDVQCYRDAETVFGEIWLGSVSSGRWWMLQFELTRNLVRENCIEHFSLLGLLLASHLSIVPDQEVVIKVWKEP